MGARCRAASRHQGIGETGFAEGMSEPVGAQLQLADTASAQTEEATAVKNKATPRRCSPRLSLRADRVPALRAHKYVPCIHFPFCSGRGLAGAVRAAPVSFGATSCAL